MVADEAHVKLGVVRNEAAALYERMELRQHLARVWCAREHIRGDAGELRNLRGHDDAVINERLKPVDDCAVHQLHRADFDDFTLLRFEPGRFQVEYDVGLIHVDQFRLAQQIPLHAEDWLHTVLLRRFRCRGKRLHHAVIRNCERLVPKALCRFKREVHVRNAVLRGHLRMQVQLDALEFARVLAPLKRNDADAVCVKHQFTCDDGLTADTVC